MIKTMTSFFWFVTHSWAYLPGERMSFLRNFIPAWKSFHQLEKGNR